MPVSNTSPMERIARVLAGMQRSMNSEGQGQSVSAAVDGAWRDHLDEATAILNTLREPDQRMAEVGDSEVWTRMVAAALGEDIAAPPGETRSRVEDAGIYQKPLG